MIRSKLRQIFEHNSEWSVAEAKTGSEAVEKTIQLKPDLVVLDFAMPGMNGLEAAAQIKSQSPRVPLILFTAHWNNVLEKRAFDTGFSVVVSKGEAANKLFDSAQILLKYGSDVTARPHRMQNVAKAVN